MLNEQINNKKINLCLKLLVRMKGQPEAEGPSEESHIRTVAKKTLEGKQPTEGLTNKQMKESNKQHSKV